MIRSRIAIAALGLVALACGARGAPLPPLQLLPPPPPELTAAQLSADIVLRFQPLPASVMSAEGVLVDLERVEILMVSQRYPALTADLLTLALDRERRDRLEEAREAVAAAEEASASRRREAEMAAAIAAAEAAGAEPPVFEEPPAATADEPIEDELLSVDEIAIRRLPSAVRQAWRDEDVYPGTILEAAQRLEAAVDDLWDYLGMPTAIVDLDRLPRLPDPLLVLEAAERVARTRSYETVFDAVIFEEEAEVLTSIPFAELGGHTAGGVVVVTHPVGLPAVGAIRTRYFFALQTVSDRGRDSTIERVVALAPSAVPLPPISLQPAVLPTGVLLLWEPPGTDILGNELNADEINYYVYRRRATEGPDEATLLTPAPLTGPAFLDTAMEWNDRHLYEVRAILQPPTLERQNPAQPPPAEAVSGALPISTGTAPPGPRKESAGSISDPLRVEDIFPPPAVLNLTAVRAATRVTLRWSAVTAGDLRGYRVYRHAAPAPELPGRVDGLIYSDPLPPVISAADDTNEAGTDEQAVDEAAGEGAGEAADEPAAQAAGESEPAAGRRQLRNRLTADGWEMLTPVVISERRFIDPLAPDDVTWIYVVEAVDASGNVSLPAQAMVPAKEKP